MKTLLLLTLALLSAPGLSQETPSAVPQRKIIRKIKIRHADPYLVYLLLTGKANFSTPPEISTGDKKG